jgi:hypothetical protein
MGKILGKDIQFKIRNSKTKEEGWVEGSQIFEIIAQCIEEEETKRMGGKR